MARMQTPKQMAASQRTVLKNMRDRVLRMADDWDEVDMVLYYRLHDFVKEFDPILDEHQTDATG